MQVYTQNDRFGHLRISQEYESPPTSLIQWGIYLLCEVPAVALAKQPFRWAFGTLQAAWKHRDALFVPKYGSLGFVALPSIWIFQVLLSALSPFAELAMIVALFAGNWRIVLVFYLGFFVLELLTGLMAYWLEGEKPWDLSLLFFQRIYDRELMYYVVAKSLIYAASGRQCLPSQDLTEVTAQDGMTEC
jgi:hypothetical protein